MWLLLSGVPFVDFAGKDTGAIDPGVFVFAHEAVAAKKVAGEEAIAADGKEHVTGTCGAEIAARTA